MLKAMYDFQANYPKTISFDEGEFFILHQATTSVRQRNWWQVVSMKGNIGFVPSNYVTNLKVSSIIHERYHLCYSVTMNQFHRIRLSFVPPGGARFPHRVS